MNARKKVFVIVSKREREKVLNENQNCDRRKNVNEKSKKYFGKNICGKRVFFFLLYNHDTELLFLFFG